MIACVRVDTLHNFKGNLLAEQHRLRHREVIQKERWHNVYIAGDMEFDRYDNPATEYYIARDASGAVLGVTRSYPTTIPYMISDVFPFLSEQPLPSHFRVLEASRLVLDRTRLTREQRRPLIDRLILAYMERGLQRGIDAYVGFMLPAIWQSTFVRAGWQVEWLGPPVQLPGARDVVRAALMPVNREMERKIREATQIAGPVLDFGAGDSSSPPVTLLSQHVLPPAENRSAA